MSFSRIPDSARKPPGWRQYLADAYEKRHGALPSPVSTAGAHLVTAPPTPAAPSYLADPDASFANDLRRKLDMLVWQQNLREKVYGIARARESRAGHTLPHVKAEIRARAHAAMLLEQYDSSDSEAEQAPVAQGVSLDMKQKLAQQVVGAADVVIDDRRGSRTTHSPSRNVPDSPYPSSSSCSSSSQQAPGTPGNSKKNRCPSLDPVNITASRENIAKKRRIGQR